jgi:uncharacterized membrane protein
MTRKELKTKAKENLRGRMSIAVLTILVFSLITNTSYYIDLAKDISSFFSSFSSYFDNAVPAKFSIKFLPIDLLLGGFLNVGLCRFLLNFTHTNGEPKFTDLFSYANYYLKTLGLHLLISLIVFVGFILLIVPGIIFAFMYSQAYYILAENPEMPITKCLSESKKMMEGKKFDFFVLDLSFIGWDILSLLTFGIVGLFVEPYKKLTKTHFYLYLKDNYY